MMSSASGSGTSTPDRLYIYGNDPPRNGSQSITNEDLLHTSESGNLERSVSPAADALSMLDEPTLESDTKSETNAAVNSHSCVADLNGGGEQLTSTPIPQRSSGVNPHGHPSSHSHLEVQLSCPIASDSPIKSLSDASKVDGSGDTNCSKLHSAAEHVTSSSSTHNSGTPTTSDSPVTFNSMGSGVDSESSDVEGTCSLTSSFTQTYHNLHETLKVPIVGFEVMEERARFTIFKVHVKVGPGENWFIFRRYTDFVRLNDKLSVLFPHFRLALPPKRWFGDNFDGTFLEDRQLGLQAFLNNVTSHKDVCISKPVRQFLCLDDPPGCHDTLEESKALCESLEEDMYHLQQDVEDRDRRISLLEQELDLQRAEIANLKKALKSKKLGRHSSSNHSISSSPDHLTEADQQRYNSSKAKDNSKESSPFKKSVSKEKFQAEMNSPNRLSIIEISEECSSTESMSAATAPPTK